MADPNLSPLARKLVHYVLAFAYAVERKPDQALVEAKAAYALAPYDGAFLSGLAEIPIAVGDPSLALEWIERAQAMLPEDDRHRHAWLLVLQGWALWLDDRVEEAMTTMSDGRVNAMAATPVGRAIMTVRAGILVELGRMEEARAEIETLLQHHPGISQNWLRKRNIHVDPALVERMEHGLALAGLPEN
jgi:adenylate cyclase